MRSCALVCAFGLCACVCLFATDCVMLCGCFFCVVVCLRVRLLLSMFALLFVSYCVLLHVFVCDSLCDVV